jgi:tellurite resistance protein TerC
MHSIGTPFIYASFIVIVLFLLSVDLGIFQRHAHAVSVREALFWSVIWILLSLSFGFWVYKHFGPRYGLEFYTGYLIEYSLSVDNIFVFILIFAYFAVPPKLHHRVLFWGILGALIMRATFIFVGAALISAFHWVIYLFGLFLVFTGAKILRLGDAEVEPEQNPVVKLFRRVVPMTEDYQSGKFVVRRLGKFMATPLALVLVTVEVTDLVFATDSIPAIFGVTEDPFIVYTSNVCAILGLRSMYFLLATVVRRFAYLGTGLGIVLMFIGVKMLIPLLVKLINLCGGFYGMLVGAKMLKPLISGKGIIPIGLSLAIVASILACAILCSIIWPPKKP